MIKKLIGCLALIFYVSVMAITALFWDMQSEYLHQEKVQAFLIICWIALCFYIIALYFYWDAPDPQNPRKKRRETKRK